MKKSQIIQEAKKVLKIEIDSTKTLSSSFNQSFYNVVKRLSSVIIHYKVIFLSVKCLLWLHNEIW